jgi:hypothetical protein
MSLDKNYRYGKVYINKKNGKIAEVLDTWMGNVYFLDDKYKSNIEISKLCNEGRLYFDDMPEGDITKWELIGEI